jgi:hypothetical protein
MERNLSAELRDDSKCSLGSDGDASRFCETALKRDPGVQKDPPVGAHSREQSPALDRLQGHTSGYFATGGIHRP